MKKHSVLFSLPASYTIVVEANNEKEARKIANEEAFPSLCHQCSDEINVDCGVEKILEVLELKDE